MWLALFLWSLQIVIPCQSLICVICPHAKRKLETAMSNNPLDKAKRQRQLHSNNTIVIIILLLLLVLWFGN